MCCSKSDASVVKYRVDGGRRGGQRSHCFLVQDIGVSLVLFGVLMLTLIDLGGFCGRCLDMTEVGQL